MSQATASLPANQIATQGDIQQALKAWENPLVRKVVRWVLGLAISAGTTYAYHLQRELAEFRRREDQVWRYTVWLHKQSGIPPVPDYIWTEPEKP